MPQRFALARDIATMEIKFAVRGLLQRPWITVAVILSLALAIGLNTTIGVAIDKVLFRELPVNNPRELFILNSESNAFSWKYYQEMAKVASSSGTFTAVANVSVVEKIVVQGKPTDARVELVSSTFFDVMGLKPVIGVMFGSSKPEVVVSHGFWERSLGGDTAAIGRPVVVGDKIFTLAGVAPKYFRGVTLEYAPDVWVPIESRFSESELRALRGRWLHILIRASTGDQAIRIEQALSAISKEKITVAKVGRGISESRDRFGASLLILGIMVGLVMIVGCANLASVMMASTSVRRSQYLIRVALGASRSSIARLIVIEVFVYMLISSVLSVLVAFWTNELLVYFIRSKSGQVLDTLTFSLDWRGLWAQAFVCGVCAVALSSVPLYRLRSLGGATGSLGMMSRASTSGELARRVLVGVQVCVCFLLVSLSGVLMTSLDRLRTLHIDANPAELVVADVLPSFTMPAVRRIPLFESLRAAIERMPNVIGAAYSQVGQLSGFGIEYPIVVPGQAIDVANNNLAFEQRISANFVQVNGLRLLAGRSFGSQDSVNALPVALVNEAFCSRYFTDVSCLGKQFRIGPQIEDPVLEVVGIVGNLKWNDLKSANVPIYFRPFSQASSGFVKLSVKCKANCKDVVAAMAQISKNSGEEVTIKNINSLSTIVDNLASSERLLTHSSSLLSAVSLVLAVIGIYSVIQVFLLSRARELGIRLALGSSVLQLCRFIMFENLGYVVVGVIGGALLSVPAVAALKAVVVEVRTQDLLSVWPHVVVLLGCIVTAIAISMRSVVKPNLAEILKDTY